MEDSYVENGTLTNQQYYDAAGAPMDSLWQGINDILWRRIILSDDISVNRIRDAMQRNVSVVVNLPFTVIAVQAVKETENGGKFLGITYSLGDRAYEVMLEFRGSVGTIIIRPFDEGRL